MHNKVPYSKKKNFGSKKLWQIWRIALQLPKFYLPIIFSNHMSRLAMLKGWVSKFHDRYHG